MTTKKSYSKSDPSGEKSGKPTNFTPPDGNSGDKKPSPQQKKSKLLWTLFLTFCKIGGFTFGGGYAMIPLIEREAVEKRRFLDGDEIVELLAISEATPGPIAVNAATFVGYRAAGVPGAFFATLGVVLPSFCILLLISAFYDRFAALRPVEYAFRGSARRSPPCFCAPYGPPSANVRRIFLPFSCLPPPSCSPCGGSSRRSFCLSASPFRGSFSSF